jgi:hypothetical protein
MTLALRSAGPDDYDVIHDGEIVGRIYRELWHWTIRFWGTTTRPEWRVIRYPRRGDGGVPAGVGSPGMIPRPRRRSGR